MEAELKYRGRTITGADIEGIRRLVAANPGLSRRALSSRLCEAWDWRQANGALCDMVCRGLMLRLHREGHIELPPVRWVNPNPLSRHNPERKRPAPVLVNETPLEGTLAEIRPLAFEQVRRTVEERLHRTPISEADPTTGAGDTSVGA